MPASEHGVALDRSVQLGESLCPGRHVVATIGQALGQQDHVDRHLWGDFLAEPELAGTGQILFRVAFTCPEA